MTACNKTRNELLAENEEMRQRLEEAEDTLRAIHSGEVDALVVSRPDGEHIFTLRGAEMPYRVLVESMNEGAASLAADGTILYCNGRLAAMLQLPLERLFGTRLVSYVASADRPVFSDRLKRCAEKCGGVEITLFSVDGAPLPVLFSCFSMGIEDGPGIGAVLTDIRSRKEAETQLREAQLQARIAKERARAEEQLQQERDRLASLVNSIQDEIWFADAAGQFTLINPAGKREFNLEAGVPPDVRQLTASLEVLHPDGTPRPIEETPPLRALRGETVINQDELIRTPSRGELRHRQVSAAPVRDASGKIIGSVSAVRDITPLKQAEAALKKLNEELEERVAARTAELREKDQILIMQSRQAAMGEMLGNIAHQWRQPLNSVGMIMQTETIMYDLGKLDREHLVEMEEQVMDLVRHMSRTIDDFRNFFRPDKVKADFNVRKAIGNTVSLVEATFKSKSITTEINTEDDPVISGFQNEYSQALLNILQNARDAFEAREVGNPRVTITVKEEKGRSVVLIADNAGGIPEDILNKVFDPYFTTKDPDKGTGVGLFMSKAIIEKNMGGQLTVRNTSDGAEFRIEA